MEEEATTAWSPERKGIRGRRRRGACRKSAQGSYMRKCGQAGATPGKPPSRPPTRRERGDAMGRGRYKGGYKEVGRKHMPAKPWECGVTTGSARPVRVAHESPGVGDKEGGLVASGLAENPQWSRQGVDEGVELPQGNDTPGVTELSRGGETPGVTTAGASKLREDGGGGKETKTPPPPKQPGRKATAAGTTN